MAEQLKRTATSDVPIVIFSRDKNFATVANKTPNIEFAGELPELLELLGMKDNVDEVKGLTRISHQGVALFSKCNLAPEFFPQRVLASEERTVERACAR